MVNSNPETVSTDFDTSDRLYFEPLDEEVGARHPRERSRRRPNGDTAAVDRAVRRPDGDQPRRAAAQRGARRSSAPASETIDLAEDRRRFEAFLERPRHPPAARRRASRSVEDALHVAERIGYPVLVRPTYVLGGRAMEIVQNADGARRATSRAAAEAAHGKPDPDRQVPRGQRGRGRRDLRRRGRAHPRHHGAHRARRRPLRRLDGRLPRRQPRPRTRSTRSSTTRRASAWRSTRAGLMNIQYVIMPRRRRRVRRLRARGQPARPAARCRSSRRSPACRWCSVAVERHARPDARASRATTAGLWPRQRPRRHQGAGLLDVEAHRRRHLPRAGDEVDRRGDGHRPQLPRGAGEGADRGDLRARRPAAACSCRSPTAQGRGAARSSVSCTSRLRLYATEGTAAHDRGARPARSSR